MNPTKLAILRASHLEHFKAAKELSLLLPLEDPWLVKVNKELNEITKEIDQIKTRKKWKRKN